ncbi:MAG TPA: chromate efflux transporter [Candidatus Kapabacteria bacterium]|nr:chromate efflux transporter [Candidatus Kapabacteria bacterium]
MRHPYSLRGLLLYFLKLGTTGFGGPIPLAGYMERDLVDARGWVSKDEFLRGLAFSKMAPGPFATQLALYIGYIRSGIFGASAVAVAFIAPSFLMVVGLAIIYQAYGEMHWMQATFNAVSAAVLGIMARSGYKLALTAVGKEKILWTIYLAAAITAVALENEPIWLLLAAGILSMLLTLRPKPKDITAKLFSILPMILLTSRTRISDILSRYKFAVITIAVTPSFFDLFWYFIQAGSVVFGSGMAIVPFLYGGVVQGHHWLTQRQFLDAVAVSMITPGPLVITTAFIGYLVASLPGAIAAALGVFLPVYLFVIILTPLYERLAKSTAFQSFIKGVTAAATGAIAAAIINLARHSTMGPIEIALALAALVLTFIWKIPEPIIILAAGVIGIVFL